MPDDLIVRKQMIAKVAAAFESFGFRPLETPALEYTEILMGKYGTEGEKLLYRFHDNGDRDISLRYDLTVPLARVVALHRPALPFKRYHAGTVWRAEKPARGRFREFMQFDVDIVGAPAPVADAEVVLAGTRALRGVGVERFKIRLNHRGLLNAVLRSFGVDDGQQEEALRILDKLEKAGKDAVTEMLAGEIGDRGKAADLVTMVDELRDLNRVPGDLNIDDAGKQAAGELDTIMDLCKAGGAGDVVCFDLSVARGLDYYTGVVFETSLKDLPGFGSVMSGGRYDGLIGMFMGQDVPAVGISIGVDRLLAGLRELGMLGQASSAVDVEVLAMGQEALAGAFAVAHDIRQAGLSCEVYPLFNRKLKAQLTFAAKQGVKYCVIVGPDEVKSGTVIIRNMLKSKQKTVKAPEVTNELRGTDG